MSLISISQIQDGVTSVNAASVNTPLNTIVNDYNGNVTDANISSAAAIAFSKIAGGSASALVAWQTWSPSYSASGSMTFTSVTTNYAKYVQIGKVVYFQINASGIRGGSTSNEMYFTLPITAAASTDVFAGGVTDTTGAVTVGTACFLLSSTTVRVRRYDAANMSVSASIVQTISCSGAYEVS